MEIIYERQNKGKKFSLVGLVDDILKEDILKEDI
jgi:hypothetical protein